MKETKASFTTFHECNCKVGLMLKKGKGTWANWKKRYFALHEKCLYYYKNTSDLIPKGYIDLDGARVDPPEFDKPAYSLNIITPGRKFKLKIGEETEAKGWYSAILNAILTDYDDEISKSGWLTKLGSKIKTWKRRFIIVRNSFVYYYKNPADKHPAGLFSLAKAEVFHVDPDGENDNTKFGLPHVMKIQTRLRCYYVSCDSRSELDDWVYTLQQHVFFPNRKIFFVDPQHDNSNTVANEGNMYFASIKEAMERAKPGDKILVSPGVYTEMLQIEKAIEIEGVLTPVTKNTPENTNTMSMDSPRTSDSNDFDSDRDITPTEMLRRNIENIHSSYSESPTFNKRLTYGGSTKRSPSFGEMLVQVILVTYNNPSVVVNSPNVRLKNISVVQKAKDLPGVEVLSGNAILDHCDITSRMGIGIRVQKSAEIIINDCHVHHSRGYGLCMKGRCCCMVKKSKFYDTNSDAIMAEDAANLWLKENVVSNTRGNGISIASESLGVVLENNVVRSCMWDGISIANGALPAIRRNTIHGNKGYGIHFTGRKTFINEDNNVYDNKMA